MHEGLHASHGQCECDVACVLYIILLENSVFSDKNRFEALTFTECADVIEPELMIVRATDALSFIRSHSERMICTMRRTYASKQKYLCREFNGTCNCRRAHIITINSVHF